MTKIVSEKDFVRIFEENRTPFEAALVQAYTPRTKNTYTGNDKLVLKPEHTVEQLAHDMADATLKGLLDLGLPNPEETALKHLAEISSARGNNTGDSLKKEALNLLPKAVSELKIG